MLSRLISVLGLSVALMLSTAHAEPRSYPNEVFDDLSLLFDIIKASNLFEDIEDPQVFNQLYPTRSFEDFDRNRSGGFVHRLDQGVDIDDLAVLDVDLAIRQFNHDIVDYDQDGILGFYELECQFANRVANAPKLIPS